MKRTMKPDQSFGRNCEYCDNPVSSGDAYLTLSKERVMCIDRKMRAAIVHAECAIVRIEVVSAARELARKGIRGNAGDSLPNLMSSSAVNWIKANQLSFRHLVSHCATLARLYAR